MLEVVQNANTIANIQKTYSSGFQSAFNKESLYRWLVEKNKERAQYVYSLLVNYLSIINAHISRDYQ